jgi:acetyltransferase
MSDLGVLLDDRRTAAVRRTGATDAAALQAFVGALSWRSRVERFLMPVKELSPRQLERVLCGRGLSLGAFAPSGAMVAHAQYALDENGCAEFGIVVADDWQGQGLGAQLMAELLEHARNAGVRDFGGIALHDNGRMRGLARRLGFAFKRDDDPQLVRMERWLGAAA